MAWKPWRSARLIAALLLALPWAGGCEMYEVGRGTWRGTLVPFEGLNAAHGPPVPAAALRVESGPGLTRTNTVNGGGTPHDVTGRYALLVDRRLRLLDPEKLPVGRSVAVRGSMQIREVYAPDGQWLSKGTTGPEWHWVSLRPDSIRPASD